MNVAIGVFAQWYPTKGCKPNCQVEFSFVEAYEGTWAPDGFNQQASIYGNIKIDVSRCKDCKNERLQIMQFVRGVDKAGAPLTPKGRDPATLAASEELTRNQIRGNRSNEEGWRIDTEPYAHNADIANTQHANVHGHAGQIFDSPTLSQIGSKKEFYTCAVCQGGIVGCLQWSFKHTGLGGQFERRSIKPFCRPPEDVVNAIHLF